MTELFLDNKSVVLPSNLEFKLYYDNPYFTSTSTHSLDIELPMPVNYHVFGMLNRLDVEKKSVTLRAQLIADGRVLLNGTALVLQQIPLLQLQCCSRQVGEGSVDVRQCRTEFLDKRRYLHQRD